MKRHRMRFESMRSVLFVGVLIALLIFITPARADFIIQDSNGNTVFKIDNNGNMTNFGKGHYNFYQDQAAMPPSVVPAFEVRNQGGSVIFQVRENGDVYMAGDFHENDSSAPSANSFIIRDNSNNVLAYIANTGHIYLRGYIVAEDLSGDNTIAYVFVTSNRWPHGDFNGIGGADAQCYNASFNNADYLQPGWLSGIYINYYAWLSHATINVSNVQQRLNFLEDNQFITTEDVTNPSYVPKLVSNGLPIYNMNGNAAPGGQEKRYLLRPIKYDEYSFDLSSNVTKLVYTGTDENGNGIYSGQIWQSVDCGNWEFANNNPARPCTGKLDLIDDKWTNYFPQPSDFMRCGTELAGEIYGRLYCFGERLQ